MRIALLVALVACKSAQSDPPAAEQAPPPPTPAPAAGSSDACDAAIRHVYDLMKASSHEDLRDPDADAIARDVADCHRQQWPTAQLACAAAATDVATIAETCNKLAFTGPVELKAGRTFDGLDPAKRAASTPPAWAQDGDFVVFDKAARCGVMKKKKLGVEAMFVVCGTEVLAGPLTTTAEIDGALAEIGKTTVAGGVKDVAVLGAALRQRFPSGCPGCRFTVYDAAGVAHPR